MQALARAPRSGLRQRQAAATRRQIIDAAKTVFEQRGYEGARIEDIAAAADVAVPTVYKIFLNKRNLLTAAVEMAMSGDSDSPIDRQAWWQEQLHEPDARRQLRLIARNARRIYERAGLLLEVVQSAARTDPGIELVRHQIEEERSLRSMASARALRKKATLRAGLTMRDVARTLRALTIPELCVLEVQRGGLDPDGYERWLGQMLENTLLADDLVGSH